VFDALPPVKGQRWINVGRLDVNTSGLLLFTTDGDLAHRLMHPSTQVQREYAVRIHGEVTPAMVKRLVTGVALEDGEARFEDVAHAGGPGTNQWFYVLLTEGRNRLVRRLWESQGVQVTRLKRVRFGPMTLPSNLSPGEIAWIKKDDIRQLYESVGLPVPDRLGVENAIVGTRQARHRR
jgi:23S rRNA pseudouridine2605 synthase